MIKPALWSATVMILCSVATSCGQDSTPLADAETNIEVSATSTSGAEVSEPASTADVNARSSKDVIDEREATKTLPKTASIQEKMDCVRETGILVAAHRGGPRRGYPENALETLAVSYEKGARVFEIDVAESKDGVLFLMHDVNLRRTTTIEGVAREMVWADIENVRLTSNGEPTDFVVPTLADTLSWAVANNVILELDKKRSTNFAAIISAVRDADAANNVILITYTQDQAAQVAELAPDMMMTASINNSEDLEALVQRGVSIENLIAWTGTSEPNPQLWSLLADQGIETAFGTLGRRGQRLDDLYWEDRDGSEYNQLEADGLTLIATDFSDRVTRQLDGDDKAHAACGFSST